jgi:hypothetical protein
VGSWWPNWGKPGANAKAGNSLCGADRKGSRCVIDPDPVAFGLAPAPLPGSVKPCCGANPLMLCLLAARAVS